MTESLFPPIQQRVMEFVRREFTFAHDHYSVKKLIGDASARQYFRFVTESNQSFILAAYPEPFDPQSFSYKQVYDLFQECSLPVPRILALDGSLGIVLQEDLGDESVQRRLLNSGPDERRRLLKQAIDLIVIIQDRATLALKPGTEAHRLAFDQEKLHWELRFFRLHYGNYRRLQFEPGEALAEEFLRLAGELASFPRFLCHRDYHVRNLMLQDERIFIIDFQDARWGPPPYDLASLLKDSVELPSPEVNDLIEYYLGLIRSCGGPLASAVTRDFRRHFHLMCIQRLLKALGTYGYQILERGNFIYEQYITGSLRRALVALQAVPEFPYIQTIVEKELRAF